MKVSETFWLTCLGVTMGLVLMTAVILFLRIPPPERRKFIELGLYLVLVLIAEVFGYVGGVILHTNMNMMYNITYILSTPLLLMFYRNRVRWPYRNIVAYALVGAHVVFGIINMLFIQGLRQINSYTTSIASFFIIIISMTYALMRTQRVSANPHIKHPVSIINTGILIYHFSLFYIQLFVDYLVNERKSNLINILYFHHLSAIVCYCCVGYALILIRKEYILIQKQHNSYRTRVNTIP